MDINLGWPSGRASKTWPVGPLGTLWGVRWYWPSIVGARSRKFRQLTIDTILIDILPSGIRERYIWGRENYFVDRVENFSIGGTTFLVSMREGKAILLLATMAVGVIGALGAQSCTVLEAAWDWGSKRLNQGWILWHRQEVSLGRSETVKNRHRHTKPHPRIIQALWFAEHVALAKCAESFELFKRRGSLFLTKLSCPLPNLALARCDDFWLSETVQGIVLGMTAGHMLKKMRGTGMLKITVLWPHLMRDVTTLQGCTSTRTH